MMEIEIPHLPFQCLDCPVAFEVRSKLDRHMIYHSEERNYSCDYCDRSYKTAVVLEQHMRVHTQERNFACDLCEDKFTQLGHMLRHRKTVHRDQHGEVLRCGMCHLVFKTWKPLIKHRRSHADGLSPAVEEKSKREFPCDLCCSTFKTKRELKTHTGNEHQMEQVSEVIVVEGHDYVDEENSFRLDFQNLEWDLLLKENPDGYQLQEYYPFSSKIFPPPTNVIGNGTTETGSASMSANYSCSAAADEKETWLPEPQQQQQLPTGIILNPEMEDVEIENAIKFLKSLKKKNDISS